MEKAHMQHIQECFKKYTFFVSHLSTARSSYLKFCSATVFSTFIYYMTLICTPHYPHPHPLRPNLFVICKNKLSLKSVNLIEYSIRDGLHLKPMFHLNHSFPLISLVSDHSLSSCITNHHYKPFS